MLSISICDINDSTRSDWHRDTKCMGTKHIRSINRHGSWKPSSTVPSSTGTPDATNTTGLDNKAPGSADSPSSTDRASYKAPKIGSAHISARSDLINVDKIRTPIAGSSDTKSRTPFKLDRSAKAKILADEIITPNVGARLDMAPASGLTDTEASTTEPHRIGAKTHTSETNTGIEVDSDNLLEDVSRFNLYFTWNSNQTFT